MSENRSIGAEVSRTVKSLRVAIGVAGALAAIVGIVMLAWPDKTAVVFTVILATYALVAGIGAIVIGVAMPVLTTLTRVANIFAGVLFIIAALVALTNPGTSAAVLAVVVVVFIGIVWIVEGLAALTTLSVAGSKVWTTVYAVLSILAGISMFLAPMSGAAVLWIWLAIALVVLGIVQVIRAIRF